MGTRALFLHIPYSVFPLGGFALQVIVQLCTLILVGVRRSPSAFLSTICVIHHHSHTLVACFSGSAFDFVFFACALVLGNSSYQTYTLTMKHVQCLYLTVIPLLHPAILNRRVLLFVYYASSHVNWNGFCYLVYLQPYILSMLVTKKGSYVTFP